MSAIGMLLPPLAVVQEISRDEANGYLVAWGHRLGALERPEFAPDRAHALLHHGKAVAVTTASTLSTPRVGAGWECLTRENTIELSRLCAARRELTRAMLRLWRELIFPSLGKVHAVSYQDAAMHRGDLYRFDGWRRLGETRSGMDARAVGYRCRRRVIWGWLQPEAPPALARQVESRWNQSRRANAPTTRAGALYRSVEG